MMNTVLLLLVSLIWGQFLGSFKHPRSCIECSHYLRVSTSPFLRFFKKKNCFPPPKLFVSFFKLGEVTIGRWGSGVLFKVAAGLPVRGPRRGDPASRAARLPPVGARPTPAPGPGPPRSSVPFHFADSLKTAAFPSRPSPSRPSAGA